MWRFHNGNGWPSSEGFDNIARWMQTSCHSSRCATSSCPWWGDDVFVHPWHIVIQHPKIDLEFDNIYVLDSRLFYYVSLIYSHSWLLLYHLNRFIWHRWTFMLSLAAGHMGRWSRKWADVWLDLLRKGRRPPGPICVPIFEMFGIQTKPNQTYHVYYSILYIMIQMRHSNTYSMSWAFSNMFINGLFQTNTSSIIEMWLNQVHVPGPDHYQWGDRGKDHGFGCPGPQNATGHRGHREDRKLRPTKDTSYVIQQDEDLGSTAYRLRLKKPFGSFPVWLIMPMLLLVILNGNPHLA